MSNKVSDIILSSYIWFFKSYAVRSRSNGNWHIKDKSTVIRFLSQYRDIKSQSFFFKPISKTKRKYYKSVL